MGAKITIIEGNSNDKNNIRNFMVKGEKGADGTSPTATVTRGTGQATVNVTDANGTTSSVLYDGISPTLTTSKTGKVTTITITDIEGTKTATINDGDDGATTNIIDSYTLTDNTTQTYSGKKVDDKLGVLNDKIDNNTAGLTSLVNGIIDKFQVLTGTITLDNALSNQVSVDYPTGFNESNCVVISQMINNIGSSKYSSGRIGAIALQPQITLSSSIVIRLGFNEATTGTFDYKVVLYRYGAEVTPSV